MRAGTVVVWVLLALAVEPVLVGAAPLASSTTPPRQPLTLNFLKLQGEDLRGQDVINAGTAIKDGFLKMTDGIDSFFGNMDGHVNDFVIEVETFGGSVFLYIAIGLVLTGLAYFVRAISDDKEKSFLKCFLLTIIGTTVYFKPNPPGLVFTNLNMLNKGRLPGNGVYGVFISFMLGWWTLVCMIDVIVEWFMTMLALSKKTTTKYKHDYKTTSMKQLEAMHHYIINLTDDSKNADIFEILREIPAGCAFIDKLLRMYDLEMKARLQEWEKSYTEMRQEMRMEVTNRKIGDDEEKDKTEEANIDGSDPPSEAKAYCPNYVQACFQIVYNLDDSFQRKPRSEVSLLELDSISAPEASVLKLESELGSLLELESGLGLGDPIVNSDDKTRQDEDFQRMQTWSPDAKYLSLPVCQKVASKESKSICHHNTDPCPYNAYKETTKAVIAWLDDETSVKEPHYEHQNVAVYWFLLMLCVWIKIYAHMAGMEPGCAPLMYKVPVTEELRFRHDPNCKLGEVRNTVGEGYDLCRSFPTYDENNQMYTDTGDIDGGISWECPSDSTNNQPEGASCILRCMSGYNVGAESGYTQCVSQGVFGSHWTHTVWDAKNQQWNNTAKCSKALPGTLGALSLSPSLSHSPSPSPSPDPGTVGGGSDSGERTKALV